MANNIKHTHELFIKPRELYVELYFMKSTLVLQTEIKTFNQLINVCIAIIIVRNFLYKLKVYIQALQESSIVFVIIITG